MRKTKPNLKVPFKCLIYCTKASKKHQTICGCHVLNDDELYRLPDGKIKYGDSIEMMVYDDCYIADNFLNGKEPNLSLNAFHPFTAPGTVTGIQPRFGISSI